MPELFNHRLLQLKNAAPSKDAGAGVIELPGQGLNLRWQTRGAQPTDYENGLADAIELIYAAGGRSSQEFADALNGMEIRCASGALWTADRIEQEMSQLGS